MAHEILSVKMYELDKKMQQVHSRIQLAEAMDAEKLRQQIGQIRQECEESQIILRNQLLPFQNRMCDETGKSLRRD